MNVLFVSHRFPYPPNHGAKIRAFNVIRHLSEHGHAVTVASLARTPAEAREAEGIRPYCARYVVAPVSAAAAALRTVARLPTPVPSALGYFHSPILARQVRDLAARTRFDLIFVHCAFAAPYVADLGGVRKVLDFVDMDSQKWLAYAGEKRFPLSLGYWLEGQKMQRAEAALARKFDLCTCATPAELDTLASYDAGIPIDWFPNGVDADYFRPAEQPYDPNEIVFTGRMDYYPNQDCMMDFCRTTLPLIRRQRPQTTLSIVGADPPRAIRALGRQPGITVTGFVPDVRPYLRRAAVAVAPLRIARGTQNKILESMAMGVPTVASTIAARGVDAEVGRHLLTAESPTEYAGVVLRLLESPAARQALADAGRARILSHHRWMHAMSKLDDLLADAVSRR